MPTTSFSSNGFLHSRCTAMWCRKDMHSRCCCCTSSAAVNWPRPAHREHAPLHDGTEPFAAPLHRTVHLMMVHPVSCSWQHLPHSSHCTAAWPGPQQTRPAQPPSQAAELTDRRAARGVGERKVAAGGEVLPHLPRAPPGEPRRRLHLHSHCQWPVPGHLHPPMHHSPMHHSTHACHC